ncbi:MAG: Lrp/AsnC ligand binding domain-containing protein [Actinomycetota bacterium]|nr:Lrp/AsnC ligand binding domain-containing protein [Actinomycetota bacterium]
MYAYILIQTAVGRQGEVSNEIARLDGVISADPVTGPYDVVVRTEATTLDELGRNVLSRIEAIEGITRTLTCPIVTF